MGCPFVWQDKLGPFCRTAVDCAIILDAIRGKDPDDLSSRDISFDNPFMVDITKLTVGYLDDAEMEVSSIVISLGMCCSRSLSSLEFGGTFVYLCRCIFY